jgi:tyrosyl-tRNA synthetase
MDIKERFELVRRNTEEIVTEEELMELLKKKEKPAMYIGTAITGRPHVAYYLWVNKLADFLKAGFKAKLLLADFHGLLDNTPWELLEKRYEYYKTVITAMFDTIGADIKDFEVVKGSDFEMDGRYFTDVLRVSTMASLHDCNKAGSEVVKQSDNPKLSGLIYPIMQALDEEYLGVDVQYGGLDQRKILMFAREYLPKIGYRPRIDVMTPMIPGLTGKKMSASVEESKIDLLDTEPDVNKKMKSAFCEEGKTEDNGVLAFTQHVIMVLKQDRDEPFIINRPEKWGGDLSYKDYKEIEQAYRNKEIHPEDLKKAVAKEINLLLEPIRKVMKEHTDITKAAYPSA